jgi:RNA polymerase sigma-70 factor (ECF subfamily)
VGQAVRINLDDNVLIEQCRKGSQKAMETLIIKYQNRIYNVILRICGNTHDAAELTQDTFVKVLQNIDKFHGRSSFYTWAFRIAVNLTINYCKRNVKLGLRSLDAEDYQNSDHTKMTLKVLLKDDRSADPALIAVNKELANIVLTAMMKLDDAHRAVMVLRDIEGMNYAQIAYILGINLGTVKSRLSRARSHLREILEAASK